MAREWNGEEDTRSPAEIEAAELDKKKQERRDLDDSLIYYT